MKMSNNYRKLCLALGLTTVLSAGVVDAANYTKTLKATFRDIKVTYNGVVKDVPEPFAVDGTTYLPVRAISEVLNAGVNWDAATSTVKITQAPSQNNTAEVDSLKQQLNTATYNLAVAEREVQKLKEQLAEQDNDDTTSSGSDISDSAIEKTLGIIEEEYYDKHRIDWSFDLSKTSSGKLDLEISYDSRDDETRFNHLSSSSLEDFAEEICETIREYHDDVEITGVITDSRTDWEKGEFTYSKSDKFDMSLMSDDFADTEQDLYRYYKKFDNISYLDGNDTKKFSVDIDGFTVETGSRSIMFTVKVSLSADEKKNWETIISTDKVIKDDMYDMKMDVESDYDKVDVEGQIIDSTSGDTIATIDANGRFSY